MSNTGTQYAAKDNFNQQTYNLFMQAPVGFGLLKGANHIIELANPIFLELSGRDQSIIGKPMADVFPELAIQGYLHILNKVLAEKKPIFLNENPVVFLKNGVRETYYINTILTPYLEGEQAAGILSVLTDVTQQVLARKKVEESKEHLQLAIETTSLGTWEFLPLENKLTWSDECKALYDLPPGIAVDYNLFLEHIYPEDKSLAQGAIANAMKPGGSGKYDVEYRILRYSDKAVVWIRAQGKVFFNEKREPLRFIGTVLNISDAKAKEEKIRISEERLRLAVEAGQLGTYELDYIAGTIIFSPRLTDMLGLAASAKYTHKELVNALHPDDISIRDAAHEKARRTGTLFYEARIIWPDASVHWIRMNGTVMLNERKEPAKVYGTVFDITEQKENERILQQSHENFKLIADAMPHMVWQLSAARDVVYVNKQWTDWSGLNLDDVKEFGWVNVIHPDDADRIKNDWKSAFEQQAIFNAESRYRQKDGSYYWFAIRTVPVLNDKGVLQSWIGTATYIHERKIAEQHKDEFISIASHELKTPVTTIKAYGQIAENMLQKKGDTETLTIIRKMGTQVNRLTDLITELLDITKIQKGRLIYDEAFFDFNALVKDVIDDMQQTSGTHVIQMQLEATAQIFGARDKISQVINNLLTNAIKYSPRANRVMVRSRLQNEGVQLSVQDFGIGISSQDMAHVFQQFYRASGADQTTYPGMGIGLYICAAIIKEEGGRIWVESEVNQGSTFHIWLPSDHRTITM